LWLAVRRPGKKIIFTDHGDGDSPASGDPGDGESGEATA
jgi:hypothetical protein